jgi:DNA invertase Pin-like site-specific DNA recombinase
LDILINCACAAVKEYAVFVNCATVWRRTLAMNDDARNIVHDLRQQGFSIRCISAKLGVSKSTVWRRLNTNR